MANLPTQIILSQKTYITLSLSLVIMIGGALITATSWFVTLQNQVTLNASDITDLKADNITSKVQLAEIKSQLTNIDSNILDIKQRLIESQK